MSQQACDRRRALVAEDDPAARSLYDAIITEDIPGVNVDLAANGAEAVKMFESRHHAVVLMDLHMPVMDGLAAFRRIEEICGRKRWAMPSVAFCTAYAPPTVFSEIIGDGKQHCLLAKPLSANSLVSAVQQRLG